MSTAVNWLIGLGVPLAAAIFGWIAGRIVHIPECERQQDAKYDAGWDHALESLRAKLPEKSLVNEPGPPEGRRPGKHSSTQLPDPPRGYMAAPLPPSPDGSNIGQRTS